VQEDAAGAIVEPAWRRALPACLAILAPVLLWAVVFVAVPPADQDFPLHDDWAFDRTAFDLAHGEGLHYYHWASMPLLGQLVLAMPIVWVFGDSHVALRIGALILACGGLAAFYSLVRRAGQLNRDAAALATACLGLNPLFFLLAATFQSDVIALSFSLIALALYAQGKPNGGWHWWLLGCVAAVFAVTTRQNAVVVPLVIALDRDTWSGKRWWVQAAAGVFVPGAAAVLANAWFVSRTDAQPLTVNWNNLWSAAVLFYIGLHGLGLSALPALAAYRFRSWRAFGLGLAGLFAEMLVVLLMQPYSADVFPYLGNWIMQWGQFENGHLIRGDRPLLMGPGIRWALTVLGCLGGAGLIAHAADLGGRALRRHPLMLFTGFHFLFLPLAPWVFDRYFVVLIPGALALAATGLPFRIGRPVAAVLLIGLGLFSCAMLHDLLVWNHARWALGERALARGIPAIEIEGGFPWDGWYSREGSVARNDGPPAPHLLSFTQACFPFVHGQYALSFSVPAGSRVLDEEPYHFWLIPGEQRFFLVQWTERPAGLEQRIVP
jgi:hypothetical protein